MEPVMEPLLPVGKCQKSLEGVESPHHLEQNRGDVSIGAMGSMEPINI